MRLIAKKGVKLYRDYYLNPEIKSLPLPAVLKVPMAFGGVSVHWNKTIGDHLQKYECLAVLSNDVPIFSPCSGVLREIVTGPALGDLSGVQYAVIETKPEEIPSSPLWNTENALEKEGLLEMLRKAGIVNEITRSFLWEGIDIGASYQKVLIDCVDDQPYDLSRTGLLLHRQNEVLGGAQMLMRAWKIPLGEILLRKNFRTAPIFRQGIDGFALTRIDGAYPVDPTLTRYTVQSHALRIGAEACRAIYRAVMFGEPQLTHIVTVWGEGAKRPANLEVMHGALVGDILEHCEATGILERVVAGGVMRGYGASPRWPLFPFDSALTAMPLKRHHKTVQCINCGRCAGVCPEDLAPYYMTRSSRKIGERRARELAAELCVGCGACAYICPARIELKELIEQYRIYGEKGENR